MENTFYGTVEYSTGPEYSVALYALGVFFRKSYTIQLFGKKFVLLENFSDVSARSKDMMFSDEKSFNNV